MKPGLRRSRGLTRVGLCLVTAALIAGMAGCSILPGSTSNPGRYNLTIISTDGGSVTSPGEDTFAYESGTSVDLEAQPAAGYRFVNWTGNIGAVADPDAPSTTITVNGRTHVIANFAQAAGYGITLSSGAGGSVTSPGEDTFTYTPGVFVDLVARPANGYRFAGWTGNVCTVADRNAASTTVTIEGHYSVTANFEQTADHREQTADYRLTLSSTAGGSVRSPGEATFAYARGTSVNLVARPSYGYQFAGWSGDTGAVADRNAASTTITIDGDYRVTANFEQTADHSDQTPDYRLTLSSTTGGSVASPGDGTFTYARGTSVNLVARPADGYRFFNWTGNTGTIASRNAASTSITINGNYSITANFESVVTRDYDLTITSTSGGSITATVDGEQIVVGPGQTSTISGIPAHTSVQLAANPHTGYHLARWQGAPVDGRRSARTSFTMQGDYSITGRFTEGEAPPGYEGGRAAIVDQLSTLSGNAAFITEVTAELEEFGFAVDLYQGDDITVNFYRELPTHGYDLIVFRSHSGVMRRRDGSIDRTVLFTNESYGWFRHWGDQVAGRLYRARVSRHDPMVFAMAPRFVTEAMHSTFDDTVIIMMGCSGIAKPDLARAFLDKGASAYLAWDDTVDLHYVDRATPYLIRKLCSGGLTIGEAVSSTMNDIGPDPRYGADLKYYPAGKRDKTLADLLG